MTFRPLDTHIPLSAFNYVHLAISDTEFEHDTDDFSSQISWTKQAFLLDSNNDQDQFLLEMADVITESLI